MNISELNPDNLSKLLKEDRIGPLVVYEGPWSIEEQTDEEFPQTLLFGKLIIKDRDFSKLYEVKYSPGKQLKQVEEVIGVLQVEKHIESYQVYRPTKNNLIDEKDSWKIERGNEKIFSLLRDYSKLFLEGKITLPEMQVLASKKNYYSLLSSEQEQFDRLLTQLQLLNLVS